MIGNKKFKSKKKKLEICQIGYACRMGNKKSEISQTQNKDLTEIDSVQHI